MGAIHPTNYRIIKVIPRACAMLAFYLAGFIIMDLDDLDRMDMNDFIRSKTREALENSELPGSDLR